MSDGRDQVGTRLSAVTLYLPVIFTQHWQTPAPRILCRCHCGWC